MLSTNPDHVETAPRPDGKTSPHIDLTDVDVTGVDVTDVDVTDDTVTVGSPPGPRTVYLIALAVSLATILAAAIWYLTSAVAVELTVDGSSQTVDTRADTVADLLAEQAIEVSGDDHVAPSLDTELTDDATVEIRYARPVTVTVDGTEAVHTSNELTVGAALAAIGAPTEGAAISLPLDHGLAREGTAVVLTTPKSVTVDDGGSARAVTSTDATVGDLLAAEGVALGDSDRLVPSADTAVTEAMTVTVTRIRTETEVRTETIAHETTERDDADLTVGTRRTETDGVDGEQDVTYEVTYTNGEPTSEEAIETVTTKEPVTEVVRVGTKPAPVQPVADPGASAGGAAADLNWAALAECESSGNPKAVNPAGYYGLYQFSLRTWASVGGSGNPVDASVAEQTNRAQILYNKAGAGQWPHCGKYLFG